MPRVGLEPMIPAFERAKSVHALDRATTVIGNLRYDPGTRHVGTEENHENFSRDIRRPYKDSKALPLTGATCVST
jgi:hypothetical protein